MGALVLPWCEATPGTTRSSSRKVRIRVLTFFSVVYFSRGSLPQKKGYRGTTGGPRQISSLQWHEKLARQTKRLNTPAYAYGATSALNKYIFAVARRKEACTAWPPVGFPYFSKPNQKKMSFHQKEQASMREPATSPWVRTYACIHIHMSSYHVCIQVGPPQLQGIQCYTDPPGIQILLVPEPYP